MKVYVLCSYGYSLNDPSISTDYQKIYEKMEKSYKMVLEDVYQTANSNKKGHMLRTNGALSPV